MRNLSKQPLTCSLKRANKSSSFFLLLSKNRGNSSIFTGNSGPFQCYQMRGTLCQKSDFCPKIECWRNLANHLIWIFAPKLNNILEFLNQISKVSISNHSKEPSLLSNQAHLAAASRSTVDVNDPVQGLVNAPLLSTSAFSNQFKLSSQFQRTSNESHHKNACISGVDTESFFNQFYLFMADPVQSIFSPFRQIFS